MLPWAHEKERLRERGVEEYFDNLNSEASDSSDYLVFLSFSHHLPRVRQMSPNRAFSLTLALVPTNRQWHNCMWLVFCLFFLQIRFSRRSFITSSVHYYILVNCKYICGEKKYHWSVERTHFLKSAEPCTSEVDVLGPCKNLQGQQIQSNSCQLKLA